MKNVSSAEYQKAWRAKNLEKDKQYKKKYYEKNKQKFRLRENSWRKRNPEKVYEISLKYKYDLSLEDYNKILIEQDHACKICKKQKKLYVDHCHSSKKIRGLLCNSCNKALGLFYDSVNSLTAAITYLKGE